MPSTRVFCRLRKVALTELFCFYVRVYLTSTNIDTRCSATKLLSAVLESLSYVRSLLPDDGEFKAFCELQTSFAHFRSCTVHYLVQFYCDRLKDHALVLPEVIVGLHALVRYPENMTELVYN